MKSPLFKKWKGLWLCEGDGRKGYGYTPQLAYLEWKYGRPGWTGCAIS